MFLSLKQLLFYQSLIPVTFAGLIKINRTDLTMKHLFLSLSLLCLSTCAFGQLQKLLHQTFELGTATQISLDLYGEYEIQVWAGNTILTETTIKLYDASPGILNHFVEKGRYDIKSQLTSDALKLTSEDKERSPIKTNKKEEEGKVSFEEVKLRLFMPDTFKKTGENTWSKPEEEEKSGDNK